jgi:hypothetical protein
LVFTLSKEIFESNTQYSLVKEAPSNRWFFKGFDKVHKLHISEYGLPDQLEFNLALSYHFAGTLMRVIRPIEFISLEELKTKEEEELKNRPRTTLIAEDKTTK